MLREKIGTKIIFRALVKVQLFPSIEEKVEQNT